jgi:outer membrane murein-binding lipoprotein Lpp
MLAKGSLLLVAVSAALAYVGCASPAPQDQTADETADLAAPNDDLPAYHDVPDMTAAQRQATLAKYATIHHEGIRQALFETAVLYYDTNLSVIPNKDYLTIVDFQKPSGKKRFFIMDMNGGPVGTHMVAHGKNSDPDDTGYATQFSNVEGSFESSLGFYQASETYIGVHGESVRLDGLSTTNSAVRDRVIVIHSATYVSDDNAKQGRSEGCFALSEDDKPGVVAQLKNGSVIYASN